MKTRRLIGILLLSALLLAAIGITAAAADTATARLRPDVTIIADGTEQTFRNAQGERVYAILYNDSHYLPLRAIGELMGKNVNWDETTLTATLSGARTTYGTSTLKGTSTTNISATPPRAQDISVQLRPDFTVVLENTRQDLQGATPLLYNGSIYLPIRAIGELMDKSVTWDSSAQTITLNTPAAGSAPLVTDADTFTQPSATTQPSAMTRPSTTTQPSAMTQPSATTRPSATTQPTQTTHHYHHQTHHAWQTQQTTQTVPADLITEAEAQSIALQNAELTASEVSRLSCRLDRDDGRWEYEVEFYANDREYDYEINAVTGAMISRDIDSIYD